MAGRSQVWNNILSLITDQLNRQNTAARVRAALKLILDNSYNITDTVIGIDDVRGLREVLTVSVLPSLATAESNGLLSAADFIYIRSLEERLLALEQSVARILNGGQGAPAFPFIIVDVLEVEETLPQGGHPNYAYAWKTLNADNKIELHTWVWIPGVGQYVDFGVYGSGAGGGGTLFIPITKDQYGTHPAFNSQREIDAFLLGKSTTSTTSGSSGYVDDINNIFTF